MAAFLCGLAGKDITGAALLIDGDGRSHEQSRLPGATASHSNWRNTDPIGKSLTNLKWKATANGAMHRTETRASYRTRPTVRALVGKAA